MEAQKVLVGLACTALPSLTGSAQVFAFVTYCYCFYSLAFADKAVNKIWHVNKVWHNLSSSRSFKAQKCPFFPTQIPKDPEEGGTVEVPSIIWDCFSL